MVLASPVHDAVAVQEVQALGDIDGGRAPALVPTPLEGPLDVIRPQGGAQVAALRWSGLE